MIPWCRSGPVSLLFVALLLALGAGPPEQRSLPNDPLLCEQWYLFAPGDKMGSPGSINAVEVWQHIKPARPIVVAVIDTGVNIKHPDLAANIWRNGARRSTARTTTATATSTTCTVGTS